MGGLFGSIPALPPWHQLDLGTESGKAIATNIANLPEASRLANLTEEQILSMMRTATPGFDAMRTQAGANINSQLKGEIPTDVSTAVQNSAAARSLGSGTAGSGFSKDLVARDLGLTSLGIMDKGLSSAESWMASTERLLSPAAATFTNMFITPGEQASFDVGERDKNWAYHWLNNQVQAMPDPTTSGVTQMVLGLVTGAGDSARGNSNAGAGLAKAFEQKQTPSGGPTNSDFSKLFSNDTASSGWSSADPSAVAPGGDYSDLGALGANAGAGVSGGYDWAAATDAYAGFA